MIPQVCFGRTNLPVGRLALAGHAFATPAPERAWDPFTPEGHATALRTIHAALDVGIRYFDTSPAFGNGHGESLLGEALQNRRDGVLLATRAPFRGCSPGDLRASVEASLRRLRTEFLDVIQLDGSAYKDEDIRHILRNDLLDSLEALRDQGKVRFIGFTVDEPWTARPLIATFRFDMLQVRYNLIDQSAARHTLKDASELRLGIVAMHPLTAGRFQQICQDLAPRWHESIDPSDVALKFVLSDPRVHIAALDCYSPDEVTRYATLASLFEPSLNLSRFS